MHLEHLTFTQEMQCVEVGFFICVIRTGDSDVEYAFYFQASDVLVFHVFELWGSESPL